MIRAAGIGVSQLIHQRLSDDRCLMQIDTLTFILATMCPHVEQMTIPTTSSGSHFFSLVLYGSEAVLDNRCHEQLLRGWIEQLTGM